jgi:hypothetical protein
MSEINYFKVFIICSDNIIADIDHLYSEDSSMVLYLFSFPPLRMPLIIYLHATTMTAVTAYDPVTPVLFIIGVS